MKQLLFFATGEDLEPLLAAVERALPVKYVRMGQEPTRECDTYVHGSAIPNLGRAASDSAITGAEYLVMLKERPLQFHSVPGADAAHRYLVDQLVNLTSISFAPGGLWGDDVLLHGRIATVSEDAESQALFKQFAREIRSSFRKVKAFWVGSQAQLLLQAGRRLTISAQASRDFDLSEG